VLVLASNFKRWTNVTCRKFFIQQFPTVCCDLFEREQEKEVLISLERYKSIIKLSDVDWIEARDTTITNFLLLLVPPPVYLSISPSACLVAQPSFRKREFTAGISRDWEEDEEEEEEQASSSSLCMCVCCNLKIYWHTPGGHSTSAPSARISSAQLVPLNKKIIILPESGICIQSRSQRERPPSITFECFGGCGWSESNGELLLLHIIRD